MITLGYLSDTHLRASVPSCRRDKDFYALQLKKFEEALGILELHEAFALHGGDLFHISNSPLSLLHDVLPLLLNRSADAQSLWVNPGNHDFFGANQETMRRSALGVLEKAGALSLCPQDWALDKGAWKLRIKAAPYMLEYPEDFYWIQDRKPDEVWVVIAHDMLTTRPMPFPHKLLKDVRTNADIVLCGHWHSQFVQKVGNTWFVNSGPLDVQAVDQRHVKPAVALIDIVGPGDIEARLKFLKTTGYEEVEVVEQAEKDLGLAEDFVRAIRDGGLAEGADLEQAVIHVAKESGYSDATVARVLGRVKEAQICSTR
jgi:DNA repair exonuclease SbcCD nuclease subunit